MKILLDGYIDRNLGDDFMLALAAKKLQGNELYSNRTSEIDGVKFTNDKNGFDCYVKIIGSGFLLHNSLGILYRMRETARERRYADKRIVIGCSIDPFPNRIGEWVIKKQLGAYDFITTRDSFSYNYIRGNVKGINCEMYPDILFSIPDSAIPDIKSEGALGICVHNSVKPELFASVADGYIKSTRNNVILICFNAGAEDDESAAGAVLSLCENKERVEIVRYEQIRDTLSAMKRCGCILGARFHSIVLSARMGLPFVPIAYSDKTRNTLNDINYKGKIYGTDFDSGEVLKSILSPPDFTLDSEITASANMHLERLSDSIR